jgi:hypothetical protein
MQSISGTNYAERPRERYHLCSNARIEAAIGRSIWTPPGRESDIRGRGNRTENVAPGTADLFLGLIYGRRRRVCGTTLSEFLNSARIAFASALNL